MRVSLGMGIIALGWVGCAWPQDAAPQPATEARQAQDKPQAWEPHQAPQPQQAGEPGLAEGREATGAGDPGTRAAATDQATRSGALEALAEDRLSPHTSGPRRTQRLQPNIARRQELLERLQPHLSRSAAGMQPLRHADGRVSFRVEQGFQHAMLRVEEADGSVQHVCVGGTAQAKQVVLGAQREAAQ